MPCRAFASHSFFPLALVAVVWSPDGFCQLCFASPIIVTFLARQHDADMPRYFLGVCYNTAHNHGVILTKMFELFNPILFDGWDLKAIPYYCCFDIINIANELQNLKDKYAIECNIVFEHAIVSWHKVIHSSLTASCFCCTTRIVVRRTQSSRHRYQATRLEQHHRFFHCCVISHFTFSSFMCDRLVVDIVCKAS